jgi:thymidylate synthase (FAD)
MNIKLLHNTPLVVTSTAIRKCWASEDKSDNGGDIDLALIDRVGNKNKHSSTLEHIHYSFEITGISRGLLQELARHRIASYSVQSSRYTLAKQLKQEKSFIVTDNKDITIYDLPRADKYIVRPLHATKYDKVWQAQVRQLEELRKLVVETNEANDILKYLLPESFKTSLVITINMRSLQNLLSLRLNKSALWEFRLLCLHIIKALPADHYYMYEDIINTNLEEDPKLQEMLTHLEYSMTKNT